VSPDGRTIVIAASDADGPRLYRGTLDRLDPAPITGTDGGSSPFFSPDGKWIGFFAYGRLKRIPADGGASVDVAAAPGYSGGASWGPDDRIVFSYGAGLHPQVVAAAGGPVEPLTTERPGRQPNVLPDGRRESGTLVASASGYRTRRLRPEVPASAAPSSANAELRIELDPGGEELNGSVEDALGGSVAGAAWRRCETRREGSGVRASATNGGDWSVEG
jgi:hypothetical protein